MKLRLLDLLACPGCGHPRLELTSFWLDRESQPPEVMAGVLRCPPCGRSYPLVDGIPRFLPDSWEEHGDRLAPYLGGADAAAGAVEEVAAFRAEHDATRKSFGFEWLRYQVTGDPENRRFFRRSTGFDAAELRGRLVLDAGCGMGRFTKVAAELGAEAVGMDLSRSVERAFRENRRPDVHFVQGDIMRPPFAAGTFDHAFSIGVLHHTPDTRRAFRSLVPLLRPGGRIAIWVYRSFQPEVAVGVHKRAFARLCQWVSDGTRAVTTRLPHRLLHLLCYAAVPVGWVKRQVGRRPLLRHLLWPLMLPPVSDHPDWRVRLCDTFDWLSPRYQWKHTTREVREWFEAEGLTGVRALDKAVSVTGTRPAAAAPAGDRRRAAPAGEGARARLAIPVPAPAAEASR